MSLAAALISFAGCQKNEFNGVENTVDGAKTFELVADIAQTKTTLDGYSVEWEEGDVIYMVTAENETGWGKEYESDEKTNVETIAEFEYSDGLFTTEAVLAAGNYTFNAIYTRANQKTWHRAAGSSHSLLSEQSQDCSNPTAHIKENDALVGTFTAAYPLNEPAKVTMSHLYTMMQVNVKNNTGNDITVKNFSVTMDGADIAGVFNVDFATSTVSTKSGASSMIEVVVENGNVANGSSLPVYFVMAPLNNYSGNVTFKVTDAEGNSYSKTVEVTGKSFEAGEYNTTSYTISEADAKIEDGTYVIAVKENSEFYAVSVLQNSSSNRRDFVLLSDYSSELTYETSNENIVWTVTNVPGGIKINNGTEYWQAKKNTIPLVASAQASTISYTESSKVSGTYVLTADLGADGVRYLSKNGTNGFGFYASGTGTSDIYMIPAVYVQLPDLDVPIVEVSLNSAKTGIVITWGSVDNASKYVVSCTGQDDVEVTSTEYEFDSLEPGEYEVTVRAEATGYNSATSATSSIAVPAAGGVLVKSFTVRSDDVVNNSGYKKYESTIDNRGWLITFGGNNKSVGTNSGNRSNCNLSSYEKYAVTPITTTQVASAFASTTMIENVQKIAYGEITAKNQANTKVYVLYSADGNTFSQIVLTKGSQGSALSASGAEFEFASCSGYFAVVFVATNANGDWRLDNVNLTFTYTE